MKRSALTLSLVALGLSGCGDDGKQTSNSSAASDSQTGGILTLTSMTDASSSTAGTASEATTETQPTTSNGTMSTMGTSDSSTTFDPNDCGNAIIDIPIVTPNVMLVLDKSGSMVTPDKGYWDHDGDDANDDMIQDADMMSPATPKITRWKSLYGVVEFITGTFENSMNLGMVLFPSKMAASAYNATACPVNMVPEVPIAPMNGMAILNAMPGADETDATIKGGTPAAKGIKAALAELATIQDGQPQIMILVTDGAANCAEGAANNTELFEVYDEALPTLVGDAFTMNNIPTYVVGIAIKDETSAVVNDGNPDNTNTNMRLNELADLGGRPKEMGATKFYDTQNQVELQAALEEIAMQILSCTIALDPVPKYPDYVEVTVNGVEYGSKKVMDCDNEDGWMFTSPDMNEIILCGKACSDFQMSGSLDAAYRCPNSG